MSQSAPLDLNAWIEEHRHLLQPPVGNACIWNNGFLVMVVGGPNRRSDYHVNPGEELFYPVQGDIVLKVVEDGLPREISIRQGDLFLLPAGVPHSPHTAPANTIGLVVEQPRASKEPQHLRWECPRSAGPLCMRSSSRPTSAIRSRKALERFQGSGKLRTCKACGTIHPA